MNIVNLHIDKLNLCYVTYIYNGRREREKEREREREIEREREGERDVERESTLQDHVIYNKMRIALGMCLPDNSLVCWPPAQALSVFHGNLPQEICGATSLMFLRLHGSAIGRDR